LTALPHSMELDQQRLATLVGVSAASAALGYYLASSSPSSSLPSPSPQESSVEKVVREFLHAQSERNLDKMCDLVADDIVYINEPHPPERAIHGKQMFRAAFSDSPCIWCPEANLKVLQSSYRPGSDTVFVERLDQFFIDGHWLRIPICGYLMVENGKIKLWKDYWD